MITAISVMLIKLGTAVSAYITIGAIATHPVCNDYKINYVYYAVIVIIIMNLSKVKYAITNHPKITSCI